MVGGGGWSKGWGVGYDSCARRVWMGARIGCCGTMTICVFVGVCMLCVDVWFDAVRIILHQPCFFYHTSPVRIMHSPIHPLTCAPHTIHIQPPYTPPLPTLHPSPPTHTLSGGGSCTSTASSTYKPPSARHSVDFPHPEGPMMSTLSPPGATCTSRPRTTHRG